MTPSSGSAYGLLRDMTPSSGSAYGLLRDMTPTSPCAYGLLRDMTPSSGSAYGLLRDMTPTSPTEVEKHKLSKETERGRPFADLVRDVNQPLLQDTVLAQL
jgi:hypothetical protein